jgi:hypothetical protein
LQLTEMQGFFVLLPFRRVTYYPNCKYSAKSIKLILSRCHNFHMSELMMAVRPSIITPHHPE